MEHDDKTLARKNRSTNKPLIIFFIALPRFCKGVNRTIYLIAYFFLLIYAIKRTIIILIVKMTPMIIGRSDCAFFSDEPSADLFSLMIWKRCKVPFVENEYEWSVSIFATTVLFSYRSKEN